MRKRKTSSLEVRPGFPSFKIALQPIVNAMSGYETFACEALVRGENGEGASSILESVTPDDAPQFDAACRSAAISLAKFLNIRCRLSLNIPVSVISNPRFGINATLKTAHELNWPPSRLIIEITENEPIKDPHSFKRCVTAARNRGVALAIDDFGSGHSSLRRFLDLRPDYLKLDMDLIRAIDRDPTRQALVTGIVNACANARCKVIAEGVETPEERVMLEQLGINLMQGYLFGKPGTGMFSHPISSRVLAKGVNENALQV